MATQPVEIHLQLAALARTTSAPIGYVRWTRARRRWPWGWEYIARLQVVSRVAAARLRAAPRPSWPALLVAASFAASLMWWVMRERMPDIDPQAVIATHLAAAQDAIVDRRYLEPLEHSALHHYRTVLALDATNAEAQSGLAALAERFVDDARASILDRQLADAVVALDGLRRVAPDHRRLPLLSAQLRRAIDAAASVRALELQEAKAATRAEPPAATREATPRAPQPRQERSPERSPAQVVADAAKKAEAQLAAANLPAPPNASGSGPMASAENAAVAAPAASVPVLTDSAAPLAIAPVLTDSAQPAVAEASPEAAGANTAPVAPPATRKLVRYIAPDYPREALMRGIEGWVDLDLTINSAGDVIASNVVGGQARQVFDRAAAGAVRRWKYEPREGADPFQALQVRVTFELKK